MAPKMHDDEIDGNVDLVRGLLQAQQPQWADLPIERIPSTGTESALYRLGHDMVVRMPLRPRSTVLIDPQVEWLPVLAPHLPLVVPLPLAKGEPTEAHPWPWSIYEWGDGEDATTAELDLTQAATDLAGFITTLRSLDCTGGPKPSIANYGRGVPLAVRDEMTRQAIAASVGLTDTDAVTAAWEVALGAPTWEEAPVWIHGDIASGNLLVQDGRLHAVIDWGCMAIGDPAGDLIVAWELFDGTSREVFRREVDVDDATWDRGRGWALSTAMMALPYYQKTNPYMAEQARKKIAAVLAA